MHSQRSTVDAQPRKPLGPSCKQAGAQRPALNAQFLNSSATHDHIRRWTFGVGCSTFAGIVTSPHDIQSFQRLLLRWYRFHGRDLPWRQTRDPYAIVVSEFMLQQTQVATVTPYYYKWLRRFPSFAALARASESDVLHCWQGLGYYARARNLHRTARAVQERHGGVFPNDLNAMRDLPGIGRYTANAVACFAFDQSLPIVEANTARLLARVFNVTDPIDARRGQDRLWRHATALVPEPNAARFNSALMDLGALVCLPRKPKCSICPVQNLCCARDPELLPIKKARPRLRQLIESHAFVTNGDKILLQYCSKRWRGMWMLPPLHVKSVAARPIHASVFPFTNHRITLRVFRRNKRSKRNECGRWFLRDRLDSIPIPSPHRRALAALLRN